MAKSVLQVHAAAADGSAILDRKLRRSELLAFFAKLPPCLVGMEACGSAHYWAREIRALGHDVRLMPPAYVKPFVKRGKTDAAGAEAISEAVTRKAIRQDFFLAGRFRNLDDLNAQPDRWLADVANDRLHATTRRVVQEAFAEERSALKPLPAGPYRAVLKLERGVSHEGMVSVGGNLYSVPDATR